MKKLLLFIIVVVLSNSTVQGQNFTEVLAGFASDKASPDRFGYAVAISGDYAVIGAPYKTILGKAEAGAVYVFRRQNGVWAQTQRIPGNAAVNRFGFSVDIDGNYMVVGEPNRYSGSVNAGRMIVYQLNTATGLFGSAKSIFGTGGSRLGYSVAIVDLGNGDAMAVGGAITGGALGQGEVRVSFKKSFLGGSDWTQGVLISAPAGVTTSNSFGEAVAATPSSVLVGVPNKSVSGLQGAGAAYWFGVLRSGVTGQYSTIQKSVFESSVKAINNRFGQSVAISRDESTIVIGEPLVDDPTHAAITDRGAVTIFRKNGNNSWLETKTLDISSTRGFIINGDKNAKFGQSVALDNNRLAIGNYIYAKDLAESDLSKQWGHIKTTKGAALFSSDISGDVFLVGQNTHDTNTGIAHFYEQPPVVDIPNVKFKAVLLANAAINTNSDTEIQVTEASAFSGSMNVINKQITDFTGLEAFTSLTALQCSYNTAPLDVSKNIALTNLQCYGNNLTALDLSKNVALDYLDCHNNNLTSLDFSQNPVLRSVQCKGNKLETLDVSKNPKLTFLRSENNLLTSLNLANGKNTALTLYTSGNPNLTCIQVDDAAASALKWTSGPSVVAKLLSASPNIDATASFSEDCAPPTVTISSSENMAARIQAKGPIISTKQSPYPVTITFSKKVTGFTDADVTVTNCTLGNLQSSDDVTYTADVTPSSDGQVTLLVAAGVVKDALDQDNQASNTFAFTYITPDPVSVAVSASGSTTTHLSPFPVTVTFDQKVTGFTDLDLAVTNGSSGNVQTNDNITFTVDITPSTDGVVTVQVRATTVKGIYNQDNTQSNAFEFTYASASAPSVSISSAEDVNTSLSPYPIKVTFSEKVTGFEVADITVTNGTASNMKTTDGIIYTLDIEPVADGAVTVLINADVAISTHNLNNTKSNLFEFTYTASQVVTEIAEGAVSQNVFVVYPNPTKDELNLSKVRFQVSKVNLIDFSGVRVKTLIPMENKVDVSDLQSGAYMIQLHTTEGVLYSRFIKD